MSARRWTLDPADFTGLWEACARCFYLHVARGYPRPRPDDTPLATALQARMKAAWGGRPTGTIAPDMPAGVVEVGEVRVDSEPLDVHLPDAVHRCVIRGTLDTLVRLDDSGYAVIDLVGGPLAAEEAATLGRRLHACAYALEHPAPGVPALGPVTRLGLVVFEPEKFVSEAGSGSLAGGLSWLEIPRDDGRLFGFLVDVLAVLERPEPPGGTPLCPWCVYRDISRRTRL